MMGTKRRVTGRRQVLNLDDREDSPRSWQAAYQQIYSDHSHQNGEAESVVPSSSHSDSSLPSRPQVSSNPLSGLLGQYNSDSEGEEESNDSVKEAENGTSAEVVGNGAQILQPSTEDGTVAATSDCSWQECYDESTGYVYYWNIETNSVTWEMPEKFRPCADWTASGQNNAQGYQLPQAPAEAPLMGQPGDSRQPRKRRHSSNDEGKIEMITSYGPPSDEEESNKKSDKGMKRKKGAKKSKTVEIDGVQRFIGPQLPDDLGGSSNAQEGPSTSSELVGPQLRSSVSSSSFVGERLPDSKTEEPECSGGSVSKGDEPDGNSLPDSSEDKASSLPENKVVPEPESAECESSIGHRETNKSEENSDNETPCESRGSPSQTDADYEEVNEAVILSKLRNRAKLLQELGGDIPEDVQQYIEPSNIDQLEKSLAEDVIAQIEQELPPDYGASAPQSSEAKRKKESKNHSSNSSVDSSPKSNSFALIAGYGAEDDSEEGEEDSLQTENGQPNQTRQPLFPAAVAASVSKSDSSVSAVFPITTESTHSTAPTSLSSDEFLTNQPSASTSSASAKDKTVSSAFWMEKTDYTADTAQNSASLSGLEVNLPDSTTSSKAFQRRKRIQIDPVVKPSSAVPDAEGFRDHPASVENESGGERRGFGFSQQTSSAAESEPPEARPGPSGLQNNYKISFIKAETINVSETSATPQPTPPESKMIVDDSSQDTVDAQTLPNKEPLPAPAAAQDLQEPEENSDSLNAEIEDISQMILDKLNFFEVGKQPVTPIKVLALQTETLLAAWRAKALAASYLHQWLNSTSSEMARHEEAAAPLGWSCQWDRSTKKYRYQDQVTGDVQWEYPQVPTDTDAAGSRSLSPHPPPVKKKKIVKLDDIKDKGGEVTSTSTDASKEALSSASSVVGVQSASLSSVGSASVASDSSAAVQCVNPPMPSEMPTPPPPPPPPPPEELPPPLPPLPPPEDQPPLPPPPSIVSHLIIDGEPPPPGVDSPEPLFVPPVVVPPSSTAACTPASSAAFPDTAHSKPPGNASPPRPPDSTDIVSDASYSRSVPCTSSGPVPKPSHSISHVSSSSSSVSKRSGEPSCSVAPKRDSLTAELDSFYSDIASLEMVSSLPQVADTPPVTVQPPESELSSASPSVESNSVPASVPGPSSVPVSSAGPRSVPSHSGRPLAVAGSSSAGSSSSAGPSFVVPSAGPSSSAGPSFVVPSAGPSSAGPSSAQHVAGPSSSAGPSTEGTKRKKKPKLAPGLALKKKGVSNLVAKWQQVQEEVRRDLMGEDDSVSSTRK